MSRYWSKLRCLKGGSVTLNENFWGKGGKGASPTNDFWHQKSRVPELSYGEKKLPKSSTAWVGCTNVTDRQTDGWPIAYSERNVVRSLKMDEMVPEWGLRRDKGSWFQRQGEAWRKDRSVIFREDDEGGRARVTTDEERVLWGRWMEMTLWRYGSLTVVRTF